MGRMPFIHLSPTLALISHYADRYSAQNREFVRLKSQNTIGYAKLVIQMTRPILFLEKKRSEKHAAVSNANKGCFIAPPTVVGVHRICNQVCGELIADSNQPAHLRDPLECGVKVRPEKINFLLCISVHPLVVLSTITGRLNVGLLM